MLDGITTRNGQERPRDAKNRARPRAGSVAIVKSGDIPVAVLYCISECRFAIIKANGDERGDCCTQ